MTIRRKINSNAKKLLAKKGFTLIELLAVIIILGILFIIAIPSVTEYIVNSRKKAYISSIDSYVSGVSQKVNSLEYSFLDKNVTYYVHIDNVHLEKGGKSPFGEWLDAYVVVTYSGSGYDYYWTSVDDAGNKIILKSVDEITVDDIINDSYKEISRRRAVGDRDEVVIIDKNGNLIKDTAILELASIEANSCYTYSKGDTGIKILSYNMSCSKEVIVPSKIEGIDVVEIGDFTFEHRKISSILIPSTVQIIGTSAFRDNNLTYLELPPSVNTIKSRAFSTNFLTEIPDISNVTSLGQNVFSDNKISEDKWFIYKKNSDGSYDYSVLTSYLGSDKDLVIPAEVNGVKLKTIGYGAFNGVGLTSVVIPDTVTVIEGSAFASNKLKKVILPSGLKVIGGNSFDVNDLEELIIPDSVVNIGACAFNRNYLPAEQAFIYARNSDGSIDYSKIISYGGKERNNVVIPETKNGISLRVIGSDSFYHMDIKKVVIPDTVWEIGERAFRGNSFSDEDAFIYKRTKNGIDYSTIIGYGGANKNPVIPQTVNGVDLKVIDDYAFFYASLNSVQIPNTVTTIGNHAFEICHLTEITIPTSVVEIGEMAFTKDVSYGKFNMLTEIVNKTGRSFDWKSITGSVYDATFVTGTIRHQYGNIKVVNK